MNIFMHQNEKQVKFEIRREVADWNRENGKVFGTLHIRLSESHSLGEDITIFFRDTQEDALRELRDAINEYLKEGESCEQTGTTKSNVTSPGTAVEA